MKMLWAVLLVALLGGSVGCSSTARPGAPATALVEARGAAAPLAAPAKGLAPVCGNFMGTPSKGEVGALIGVLVLLSPIIIPVLVLGAPLWLLSKAAG